MTAVREGWGYGTDLSQFEYCQKFILDLWRIKSENRLTEEQKTTTDTENYEK